MKATQSALMRMHRWIDEHQSEIIEELQGFARIRSVSRADLASVRAPYGPEMREMLNHALMRGASFGFDTTDHEGHCGSITWGDPNRAIGIFGHLDVVPEGENWTWPPFAATRQGDFLIGRGTSDNKSACIIGLMLMRMYKELGISLRHGLRLVCGCSEETGMSDMEYFAQTQVTPQLSLVPDMRFPVCYAQKGMMKARMDISLGQAELLSFIGGEAENMVPPRAEAVLSLPAARVAAALSDIPGIAVFAIDDGTTRVCATGLAAHAAYPETGRSAIHLLADTLVSSGLLSPEPCSALSAVADVASCFYGRQAGIHCEDPETGKTTTVLGTAETHDGQLYITVDGRLSIATNLPDVERNFSDYAARLGFHLSELSLKNPFYISKDDPKVTALMQLYGEMTGDDAPAYTSGGGTYSRCLENAITFGPGFPGALPTPDGLPEGHGGAHAPDEYIHIPTFIRAMKIFAAAIIELDQL